MSFEFTCPQGHILTAEPHHAGRLCQCPQCGAKLKVPPAPIDKAPQILVEGKENEYRAARWQGGEQAIESSPFLSQKTPKHFHIPCPNGHPLETSPEMFGKFAMCPKCQAKFKLEHRHSVEFLAEEKERVEKLEAAIAKRWLHGTIIAVVLTLLAVILLFALA